MVLVGPDAAADVVSASVIAAFRTRAWPDVCNPRAYLYRAVLNESRMVVRREARRVRVRATCCARDVADAQSMPQPEVFAAVAALSLRQRAVVYLTYWKTSYPELCCRASGYLTGGPPTPRTCVKTLGGCSMPDQLDAPHRALAREIVDSGASKFARFSTSATARRSPCPPSSCDALHPSHCRDRRVRRRCVGDRRCDPHSPER